MALSAPLVCSGEFNGLKISLQVKSASVLYQNALCMFDGTSGNILPYDGTIGNRLAGWYTGQPQQQPYTYFTGDGTARAQIDRGGLLVLRDIPITGVTTMADQGKPVYATADGTYTLTDPTTHRVAVGYVAGYGHASGYGDLATSLVFGTLGA